MFATVNVFIQRHRSARGCGSVVAHATSLRLPWGMRPWPLDSHCRLLSGQGDGQISSRDRRHTTGAPWAVSWLVMVVVPMHMLADGG